MAFADLGSLGATGSTSNNQASLALTTAAAAEAGELVVIVVADDNLGSGADQDDSEVASVADSGGNSWTKAKGFANTQGGSQAGASVSLWYSVLKTRIASGGTITATFTSNTLSDATGLTARHFSFAALQNAVAVEATNTLANDGADPGSLDATTANIACLRVRGIGGEVGNDTSLTPTANWVAWANGNSATTGTTAEMCARAEHHISTGTGDASDPTWVSCDNASVYVAFKEVALPAYAQDWPNPRGPAFASSLRERQPDRSLALLYPPAVETSQPRAPVILAGWTRPWQNGFFSTGLLATTLGAPPVASPFAPLDWPNPRGAAYPSDLRTFLNQTEIQLVGQDRVFGDPGQVPDYDWPNPRGPTYPSELRTFLHQTERLLIGRDTFFAGQGQAPSNLDWPNPRGAQYPLSLRTHIGLINPPETIGTESRRAPQIIRGWTLDPGPSIRAEGEVWQNRLTNLLAGKDQFFGLAGHPAYDWPVPKGAAFAIDLRTWAGSVNVALSLTPTDKPFLQTDWPNPLRRPVPSGPLLYRPVSAEGTPATAAPFAQTDWPNPRGYPQTWVVQPRGVRLSGFDTFYGAPGQAPTYEMPNPNLGRPYPIGLRTHLHTPKAYLLPTPFAQIHWPNPRGAERSITLRTHIDQVKLNLSGADQFFGLAGNPTFDWPNPRGPRSFDLLTWTNRPPQEQGEAPPVVDTTDHADGGYEWEGIRRRVEEIRGLRRKDDKRKREAQKRLTALIEQAYNKTLGIEPEVAQEIAAAAVQAEQAKPIRIEDIDQPLVRYDWGALARDLAGLEELLRRIDARKADEATRVAAFEAEEDDVMILLMVS